MHFWSHFCTITRHKLLVARYCFALRLFWQGLCHDLSKYSPTEFWAGAKYYQGTHSPNDAQRKSRGYSAAWVHHKGRNKHHFEYWVDYSRQQRGVQVCVEMPARYVAEMLCDRIAACRIYEKKAYTSASPWNYYCAGQGVLVMHPNTKALLERMLLLVRDSGEKAAFAQIRRQVLPAARLAQRKHSGGDGPKAVFGVQEVSPAWQQALERQQTLLEAGQGLPAPSQQAAAPPQRGGAKRANGGVLRLPSVQGSAAASQRAAVQPRVLVQRQGGAGQAGGSDAPLPHSGQRKSQPSSGTKSEQRFSASARLRMRRRLQSGRTARRK